MLLTHTNSVYTENTTLLGGITYPQYVHRISDGGVAVSAGLKMMPAELVRYVLHGKHGAAEGTHEFIKGLNPSCKLGLILAAGNTSWTGHITNVKRSPRFPVYKIPAMAATQIYAGYIANRLGSFDYISTDSTSCISGHSAWYTASNLLKLGVLDAVVVISVDNGISEEYLTIFGEHGLSKLSYEEDYLDISKFRLGQGCNISVFESECRTRASKSIALAYIDGIHITAESHNSPLGISPTGEGYRKVIDAVDISGIDFIKTHSTFSADNKVEMEIIKEKFGGIKTINYKLRIGHTMGASTAIETALAIQEESGTFLSLGAGMGNVFSSVVAKIL